MMAPETPCEKTGSEMKRVWELTKLNQTVNGPSIMDGVILRDADVKCIGGTRDEAICSFIAQCLEENGRRAVLGETARRRHNRPEHRERLGIHVPGDSKSLARILAEHNAQILQEGPGMHVGSDPRTLEDDAHSDNESDVDSLILQDNEHVG